MRMTFLCVLFVLCFARPGGAQDRALVARAEAYTAALNARDATKATSFYTEDAVMYGDGAAFVKGLAYSVASAGRRGHVERASRRT